MLQVIKDQYTVKSLEEIVDMIWALEKVFEKLTKDGYPPELIEGLPELRLWIGDLEKFVQQPDISCVPVCRSGSYNPVRKWLRGLSCPEIAEFLRVGMNE